MTKQEIFDKVQAIVVEQLDVEPEEIKMESDIKEDLEADSLDVFEIMNELEDELDIKLEADENVKTIADVVAYVEKEVNK